MLTKFSSGSILKISAVCVLTGSLILMGATIATSQNSNDRTLPVTRTSQNQAIDLYTDHFFHQANPELNGRKLVSSDRLYIREWNNLRVAIAPLVKPAREVCFRAQSNDSNWEFGTINGKSYSDTYDYLADVIFYSRHPEMEGQKLSRGTAAAEEWSAIRGKLFVYVCGL